MDINNLDDYSIKGIRNKFKKHGVFYTPTELTKFMHSFINVNFKNVYDPTCGRGGLFYGLPDEVEKYGQDIDEDSVNWCKENITNFHGASGDVLKNPSFLDKKFNLILGNPPFSVEWEPVSKEDERFKNVPTIPTKSKADFAFLIHILHYLADEGQAIILNFPGICYRGNREGEIRKWMIEQNYIDEVVEIEGNTFEDTTISTVLWILRKNKKTTDIKFSKKDGKSRVVNLEEVRGNDYKLSVSLYIQEEKIKEEIDIKAINYELVERLCARIKYEIEMNETYVIIDKENTPTKEYIINRILETLKPYMNTEAV